MRGRLPTPTNELRLTGSSATRKPGRAGRNEPQPEIGRPERPEWLSPLAVEEWDLVIDMLVETGTIAKCEGTVLALYATCLADYREADAILRSEEGGGMTVRSGRNGETVKPHPAVAIRDRARKDALLFARELGLSPVARVRVSAIKPPADPSDKARFFSENKGRHFR